MATNPIEGPASTLRLRVASAEDNTVVRCCGRLTADVTASFKEQVKGMIANTRQIVLDLSDVAYMDSSGLSAVVSLYVSTKRAGCGLRLINLTPRIRELFGMTNLLSVFETTGQYFVKMP